MKEHNLIPADFNLDEIESIELIGEKLTMDITVDDTHMFYANDIYTHNSAAKEDIIEADSISDSYRKIMTADFVMSLSRKMEDKLNNTARVHVIKNRFGPDGLTYNAAFDTSCGSLELYETNSEKGKELQKKLANGETDVRNHLREKWHSMSVGKSSLSELG